MSLVHTAVPGTWYDNTPVPGTHLVKIKGQQYDMLAILLYLEVYSSLLRSKLKFNPICSNDFKESILEST